MYIICYIDISFDRCLVCFHILLTVNNAAMGTEEHRSFLIVVFIFFG